MRRTLSIAVLAVLLVAPPPALAQLGVVGRASTLGLGGEVVLGLSRNFNLRGSANFFPSELEFEYSGIEYSVDLPSPSYLLALDLVPFGGGFRISGGLLLSKDDIELTATPTEPVDIGETTYQPSEIGSLTGALSFDDMAPYVGIGFGNPLGRGKLIGFVLDLGIAVRSSPAVTLGATGQIARQPEVLEDLDREARDIEEDIDLLQYYPVLSLGLSIRIL